jgi:predicted Zn-dependent protease
MSFKSEFLNAFFQEAEKLVSLLTKKFRDNKQAWLQCGEVLLKLGKLEKARSLMQRAITSLDKKLRKQR